MFCILKILYLIHIIWTYDIYIIYHFDIFQLYFIHLRYILLMPLKWLLNFLKSQTSTDYFSNSINSLATSRRHPGLVVACAWQCIAEV